MQWLVNFQQPSLWVWGLSQGDVYNSGKRFKSFTQGSRHQVVSTHLFPGVCQSRVLSPGWRGVARGSINMQITDADIHGYCGASFPANAGCGTLERPTSGAEDARSRTSCQVITDWVVLVAAAATGTVERMQQQAGKGVCERRATVQQGRESVNPRCPVSSNKS